MLNNLCGLYGISGLEKEVRDNIKKNLHGFCDILKADGMGNLIAVKKGTNTEKKLFLVVPMDEPGVIVSQITEDGYVKFHTVGRLRPEFLVSKRVCINGQSGVIALKAVHLASKEEREKPVTAGDLFIDIGADSRQEAEAVVTIGDYGVLDSEFILFGNEMIKGRALGSRISCAVAVKLLQQVLPVTIETAFTTQREIGCRGMVTAIRQFTAENGIILDGIGETEGVICQKGVVLPLNIPNIEGCDAARRLAQQSEIPLQTCITQNDDQASVLAKAENVQSYMCLGIPVRYQESASQVASQKDKEALYRLLLQLIDDYAKGGFWHGIK